jgi:hypothetical protein
VLLTADAKTTIGANTIAIIDFAQLVPGVLTFANLTAAAFGAAINVGGTAAGVVNANADAAVEKVVFLVAENAGSVTGASQMKVFTADAVATSIEFANVVLVGTIDLADVTINTLTAGNFN